MEILVYRFRDKLIEEVKAEQKYQETACSDWIFKKLNPSEYEVISKSGEKLRKYFLYDDRFVQKIQGMRITKAQIIGELPSTETLQELVMRFSRYEPLIIIR